MQYSSSAISGKWLRGMVAAAAIAVLLLPVSPYLQARSQRAFGESSGIDTWQHVHVRILARGSHVSSGAGNMDSYLVLLSNRKNRAPFAARLVDYYASFEHGITDEAIASHGQFRVTASAAIYCEMDAKAFVISRAFDPGAIEKISGSLPCFVVRQ